MVGGLAFDIGIPVVNAGACAIVIERRTHGPIFGELKLIQGACGTNCYTTFSPTPYKRLCTQVISVGGGNVLKILKDRCPYCLMSGDFKSVWYMAPALWFI